MTTYGEHGTIHAGGTMTYKTPTDNRVTVLDLLHMAYLAGRNMGETPCLNFEDFLEQVRVLAAKDVKGRDSDPLHFANRPVFY